MATRIGLSGLRLGLFGLIWATTLPTASADALARARSLLDERQYEQAVSALRPAFDDPALGPQALVLATYAYYELGDAKHAVEHGKRAIKALPEDSRAHVEYARALRIKMQDAGVARALFTVGTYKKMVRRALELDPDNVDAREEEIGFLIHAPGIAGGDTDKARERLAGFKQIDWRRAMLMQAQLHDEAEDVEGGIATYIELVERLPDDTQARMGLASRLQRAGRYAQSDVHFKQLLESDDARLALAARYQLARSRILGAYEQQRAVELLQSYIDLLNEPVRGLPGRTDAYWRLGNAYEQLDRIADARAAYRKALEIDGKNGNAREALTALPRG